VSTTVSAVVVDDTPDIRMLLTMSLEMDGDIKVVGEAGDGRAGVDLASQLQPDVVLIDLAMPVMDGLEALPLIRKACPRTRVVVLSGFEADAMAQRALDAGADGYLQKGLPVSDILDYVRLLTGLDANGHAPAEPRHPTATIRRPEFTVPPLDAADAALVSETAGVGLLLLDGPPDGHLQTRYLNDTARGMLGLAQSSALVDALVDLCERRRPQLGPNITLRDQLLCPDGVVDVRIRRGDGGVVVSLSESTGADEANRLRQALSTTAHEIRNPVTVLVGVAHTIDEAHTKLTEEQRSHLLGAVVRQASVLDRVTEDLLTAGQARGGSITVECRPVQVEPLLADATSDLPPTTDVLVRGARGVQVLADPTRLAQMVANLLSNAMKYGQAPYSVRVTRETSIGDFVRIAVEDSGPGIGKEFRERLFEEFSREPGSGRRGTGLGLFVVRSLAEAQGGWVDYAANPAGGSTFTITLPAA
jgi:signal transduction histidine kinase/ActR/RegA family two-component response regulator